ncbi:MAG: DUF362 domain-containing protein [Bacteroidales bacterium]|nr:DUF362 domain-containing protein [Bacteroidales bacterium]
MEKKINRREFIRKSGTLGVITAGASMIPGIGACSLLSPSADISVVSGAGYFANTLKAIDLIGGMKKFIPEGSTVGLLINSDFDIPGTYVNPDVAIAAVKSIFDAGAQSIICLQKVKEEYWERSSYYESHKDILSTLKQVETNVFPSEYNDDDFIKLTDLDNNKALKETEVVKAWLECDVFVNIPICKHHASTLLTGAMKNIMGVSTRKANVTFHLGSGVRNDPDYLAQCIVDQNLVRKSDLCIMDATEFITDNGPSGPGTLKKPQKIIAGADMVAIDAIAAEILGYSPGEILCVVKGHESGLGNKEYSDYNLVELNA